MTDEERSIEEMAKALYTIYTTDELSRSVIDITMTLLSATRGNLTKMKILVSLLESTGNVFFSAIKSIESKNN
jgi:hypothetical protein